VTLASAGAWENGVAMGPEDRDFMRQLLLRHEKAIDAMIAGLEARTAAIVRRIDANTEAMQSHTREFVAEMRAQRQALFRVLDRLDGPASA
jgi:hypothetical protein